MFVSNKNSTGKPQSKQCSNNMLKKVIRVIRVFNGKYGLSLSGGLCEVL